jgi:thioredoxin reductase (NADPH)
VRVEQATDLDPILTRKLSDAQVQLLRSAGGVTRTTSAGEVLFKEGDPTYEFIVILEGTVAIVDGYGVAERELAVDGARAFVAELNLFTGERLYTTAIVREPGSILVVPPTTVTRLIGTAPDLGDVIMPALFARRQWLLEHRAGFEIVGSRFSADTARLREFATRNRLAHVWVDLDYDESAQRLLDDRGLTPAESPVVQLRGGELLVNPSHAELARAVGLVTVPDPTVVYDLVVVGAGPAGLASCVYASSEGLSVAAVDAVGPGGQIGTTTRFENYLGFPVGISGEEFAARAVIQAQRFGTQIFVPRRATGLDERAGYHVVLLDEADEVAARSVIVATGIEYRRLDVPGIDRFEGISVFYSPLDELNRVSDGAPAVVVGGGNSAGQAATALAAAGHDVFVVVRAGDLTRTMVRYLIDRIDREPRVEVIPFSEVVEVTGDGELETVVIEDNRSGVRRTLAVSAAFVLIGAAPYTDWLAGALRLDDDGFILTGASLGVEPRSVEPWRTLGREPLPMETSRAGVFAAGDIRADSTKRVGSAVGDGSLAARLVHQWLGTVAPSASRPSNAHGTRT